MHKAGRPSLPPVAVPVAAPTTPSSKSAHLLLTQAIIDTYSAQPWLYTSLGPATRHHDVVTFPDPNLNVSAHTIHPPHTPHPHIRHPPPTLHTRRSPPNRSGRLCWIGPRAGTRLRSPPLSLRFSSPPSHLLASKAGLDAVSPGRSSIPPVEVVPASGCAAPQLFRYATELGHPALSEVRFDKSTTGHVQSRSSPQPGDQLAFESGNPQTGGRMCHAQLSSSLSDRASSLERAPSRRRRTCLTATWIPDLAELLATARHDGLAHDRRVVDTALRANLTVAIDFEVRPKVTGPPLMPQ